MDKRSYDMDIAGKVGEKAAILYEYLAYWCERSGELHDGLRWIFKTIKGFQEVFPNMNERTIRRCLNKLESSGYIKTGNYNKIPFDKTKWYAVSGVHIEADKMSESKRTKCPNDMDKMSTSEADKMSTPIQTNNNYINLYNNKLYKGKFTPPTLEEVKTYCLERDNGIDPEAFIDYYESKGWMVGKNKMKDWKAAVRTWEKNRKGSSNNSSVQQTSSNPFTELKRKRGWL